MGKRFDSFKKFVKRFFWDAVIFVILMIMNRANPLRGLAIFTMLESACYLLKYFCIKFFDWAGFDDEEINEMLSDKKEEKDSKDSDKEDKNKV